ncbi:MetQ/NlpA family ABC transporter substrate-binding protein [Hutsoniella sourekii]
MKKFIQSFAVLSLAASLFAGTGQAVLAQDKEFEGEKVTIGLAAGPEEDVWEVVQKKAKEEEGIDIEFEVFTDYNPINTAVADGSLDLNAFQHEAFLDEWNEANQGDLKVLGYTYVSSMGAYSETLASLDDLQDGDKVAIPNDPTNGGRALLALELAGVIKVDPSKGVLVTPEDITDNPKNIEIVEADAAQLPALLPDVAAAIINTNFAVDAGLDFHSAIFVDAEYPEKLNDKYKNVVAAKEENAENPLFKKVVELYQSEEVAQAIYDASNGGDKPAWDGAPRIESASNEESQASEDSQDAQDSEAEASSEESAA